MWGTGPLKDLLDTLALYGITEGDGWSPVHAERKGWLIRRMEGEEQIPEMSFLSLSPSAKKRERGQAGHL